MDQVIRNLHMNGGTGETSYSFNSLVHKKAFYKTKPMIDEGALDIFSKFYTCSTTEMMGKSMPIGIADLGCSSGPNTLLVFSYVLNIIYNKCCEFDINDFNTLFKYLESFRDELKRSKGDGIGPILFTLSILPTVSNDIENSNQRKIYISKSNPLSITEAYLKQFKSDFTSSLKCRSGELVKGGRMVLTLLGRRSADPTSEECCYFWEILALALSDIVLKKLISFNLVHYMPSDEELKIVIQYEGSFMINQLEAFQVNWDGSDEDGSSDIDSYKAANCLRAVSESLLMSHFGIGEEIVDELFHRDTKFFNTVASTMIMHAHPKCYIISFYNLNGICT
ncbi:hypothetical protein MKX01_007759 [Papaver californicum]|nr:hypothetical protein MKX01_007759 [Papaver californicum]